VVVNGSAIGIGSSLAAALTDSLGEVVPPEDGGQPPQGSVEEQIQVFLDQAAQHFAAADAALRAGDLAKYQTEIKAAQAATAQAQQLIATLLGAQPSGSPSPSVTASPSPSPSG
jgi:uncharacterized protein